MEYIFLTTFKKKKKKKINHIALGSLLNDVAFYL